jgi:hypothetical protein
LALIEKDRVQNEHERVYRKMARWSLYGVLLWIPVMGAVGYIAVKVFNASWPFFTVAFTYMGVMAIVSVRCIVARWRWKHSSEAS